MNSVPNLFDPTTNVIWQHMNRIFTTSTDGLRPTLFNPQDARTLLALYWGVSNSVTRQTYLAFTGPEVLSPRSQEPATKPEPSHLSSVPSHSTALLWACRRTEFNSARYVHRNHTCAVISLTDVGELSFIQRKVYGRAVMLTTHPLLVPWVKKESGQTSSPPMLQKWRVLPFTRFLPTKSKHVFARRLPNEVRCGRK
jgi:hypothetical protein